jgi:maleate isomerase
LALEYGETFGFPVWIDRCGVLAGAGQFGQPAQGIFAWWIHRWVQRKPLKYIGFEGRGLQVRDCLHPADLAALLAHQLADAQCDVQAYACLVAVMVQGPRAHEAVAVRLRSATAESGFESPIVTSAGALVDEIKLAGYTKVSLIAPYLPELTATVVRYIEESAGVEVVDAISLGVSDNCEVGRLPQANLVHIADTRLNVTGVDAVILSSCVQMPSLNALVEAETRIGLPCLSAAAATSRSILRSLNLDPGIPGFGSFLAQPEEVAR